MALIDDAVASRERTRTRTISRPTTGSPTRRSSGSSTRSSSRRPRTARATSTSSRRRTRSSSASGSTACCTSPSGSRCGSRPGVTTRLKVLAKLDIAERRKPQDGRISLNAAAAGRLLDIRVATLPTVEGESVTMRLLDKSREAPTLEELGLSDAMRDAAARRSSRGRRARCSSPARPARASRRRCTRVLAETSRPEINVDHRRGPGRVPARRHQPGADQPARRPHVRDCAALDPALRPGRRDGRRDPRRRDGPDLDRGGADRPLRALDDAHERRAGRDHAAERDGRRAVHHRRRRLGRAGAAARAEALPALRGALRGLDATS